MASISIRMRKTSNVSGRVAHDFRKRTPGYADPEKEDLNATLLGQPVEQDTLRQELDRTHREKTGRRRRKDSALIWEGIITFSADADLTNREAFDQAALDLIEQIAKRHDFTEPLWLVRHEDESRPHYHFAFANAHSETAKPVRLSPSDMSQLQDLAGQCFKHLGLSRGKPKEERITDGEPAHKWINRSVKQLHNDLPKEIEALRQRIEELTEKERKTAERLEKTLQKLQETEEANEKLQKRAKTYQKRLETTRQELEQAQKEIKRLKKIIEPHKPEPIQIKQFKGWKETGLGPFKLFKSPILKPVKVISPKAAENALIATRKATETEARRKAEAAVLDKLKRLQELEQQLEQNNRYRDLLLEAIEKAAKQQWLSGAQPEHTYRTEQNPPEIVRYNATLLDYNTKLVAIGDGTPIQQAAAIYSAAKEKGWEKTIFWGMNEAQIEWLVKAAMKDGYNIDFKEDWAREHAEKIRQELKQKQPESNPDRTIEL